MTTYDYNPNAPTGHEDPKDQALRTAEVARDQGKHVGEVAKSEAQTVAADAKEQARHLMDDARTQLHEQSRSQLDNLVLMLQGFGDDLERMARGEGAAGGLAQDVVTQVSDRARTISSQIKDREPGEILDQVRDFARRKPGTFLLGALAAGVVAGRVTRGAKDAHSDASGTDPSSTHPSSTESSSMAAPLPSAGPGLTAPDHPAGTAAGNPLAGTGMPPPPPGPPMYPEGGPTS